MIPYGKQNISQKDVDQVVEVLTSDFLTQGPMVPGFEQAIAEITGASRAIAVNSATSALHIACLALGLSKGDLLWTSPITFVASANVGLLCGADVDFVDVDPATLNMCPDALKAKLEDAAIIGQLPKIIIPVHMTGQSCDMEKIYALAKAYDVRVIEDASHAIGGKYKNNPIGSCLYSDVTVFSFHPVKIVTTAEGGLATTQDPKLARRMELFRSHGVTRAADEMLGESHGPWYYQQIELGLNYRMTELQAALGRSQLNRLEMFVEKRNELARVYDQAFSGHAEIEIPGRLPNAHSAFHLYIVRVPAEKRRRIFERLRADGIGVNVHYIPVHLQPYYKNLGFKHGKCPKAEASYEKIISLPLYPDLSPSDQKYVVSKLKNAVQ